MWPGLVFWAALAATGMARGSTAEDLDESFQSLGNAVYGALIEAAPPPTLSLGQLEKALRSNLAVPQAAILVRAHKQVLLDNFQSEAFWSALKWLYRANDTATVQVFMDSLKQRGNPLILSRSYFLLARYYEAREQWGAVQGALAKVNNKFLTDEDAEYAVFLRGYALQLQKKHRKAAEYYQAIPPTSAWYPHAKLNEGIAYLRQGWWSEAHAEFGNALKVLDGTPDEELKNRLLVVLGFSQLHFEFYRDARETLRKVSLDSPYTSRALLGLGLAAAHQSDFAGALNAFRRLTEQKECDESVDEAWLLVPHVYEELGQPGRALEAYEDAKAYYQQRLAELANKQKAAHGMSKSTLERLSQHRLRAQPLHSEVQPVPDYIAENFRLLQALHDLVSAHDLDIPLSELTARYEQWMHLSLLRALHERMEVLGSYRSQAQFGIATLYDQ